MNTQSKIDEIHALIRSIPEGIHPAEIPFLAFIRRDQPTPHIRGVLSPSICLIVQGAKKIHIDRNIIEYGVGDFAAAVIDMPTAGHVAEATPEKPYLGLRVEFTLSEVMSVVSEAQIAVSSPVTAGPGAFVGKASPDVLDLFLKLLRIKDSPEEARFIAPLIKKEMIFRLLRGPYGHLFLQKAVFDKTGGGIGRSIDWIRKNFAKPFKVEELATLANLSISTFHHRFKAVTTMGPLQYQKQLRLLEARRLMLIGLTDAATVAFEVGYESPSQFSREYKRFFGQPPLRDVRSLGVSLGGSAVVQGASAEELGLRSVGP